jgi:hypothetical protein
VAVQSDGRIVVSGAALDSVNAYLGLGEAAAVTRVRRDGSPDGDYNAANVYGNWGPWSMWGAIRGSALQPDDKLVLTGADIGAIRLYAGHQVCHWVGGEVVESGPYHWSAAANWQDAAVPAEGDVLVFEGTGVATMNDIEATTFGFIRFDGDGFSISAESEPLSVSDGIRKPRSPSPRKRPLKIVASP